MTPPSRLRLWLTAGGLVALAALFFVLGATDHGIGRAIAFSAGTFAALLGSASAYLIWKLPSILEEQSDPGPGDTASHPGATDGRPAGFIRFFREANLVDAARSYGIEVSGVEVGRLRPGSSLTVAAPTGEHECRASISWTGSKPLTVAVREGDTVNVSVTPASQKPRARDALRKEGYLVMAETRS